MGIPSSTKHRYQVIYCLYNDSEPTRPKLSKLLSVSERTISGVLKVLRSDYGVVIAYQRKSVRGNDGFYQVEEWGVFDIDRTIKFIIENGIM